MFGPGVAAVTLTVGVFNLGDLCKVYTRIAGDIGNGCAIMRGCAEEGLSGCAPTEGCSGVLRLRKGWWGFV